MKTPASQFGLRESLSTLFRRKTLILGIALLTCVVSFSVAMLQSKVWESSARIVVQQNRQAVRVGSGAVGQDVPFGLNRSEQVRTELEIISSPVVLAETVNRLGPQVVLDKMRWRWDWLRELPDHIIDPVRQWVMQTVLGRPVGQPMSPTQLAMRKVGASLSLEPVREAAVFTVGVEAPDPQFAALIVDTVIDVYLDHHIAVRQVAATSGVFATESQRLRAELEVATARRQALKSSGGVVSVGPQKQLLLQRLNDAEAALARANIDAIESARRITEAERQLSRRAPEVELQATTSRNPALDSLRQQLAQLEIERGNYLPGSPAARSIEIEIDSVKARMPNEQERINSSRVSGLDTTYREVERGLLAERARLSALSSRADLRRQIDTYRAELKELDTLEAQLHETDRDVDLTEEALRSSLRKQEEERLGGLLNEHRVSDVVPIEPASVADRPSRPRVMLVTFVGLGTGLLAGLALAFLCEYFRRTIATREEAADQLGVPVVASLLDTRLEKAAGAVNQIEVRRIAEALRQERASSTRGLSILITSTSSGEGKSLIAAELAALLGRRENACVLVDASEQHLKLPAGMARIDMSQTDAAVIETARQALQSLCEQYDVVLLDGPAVGSSGNGLWLPEIVDRVILVVQAEHTTGVNAMQTLRIIEAAGGRLMGVVLNRRRLVIPGWVYGWLLSPRHAMQP
ncbi:MAG: Wzz/FepE/Etk N-terminal domain-containing protein [Burkholderiaceae bacterium]|nr:Wzz/FepE/Etk N-terminal domain-containing protein [Burkholderiaceae bacterium]